MTYPNPTLIALLASGRRELTTTPPEDTAVIDAETPVDPIPAEGAPHAYVALKRTHSVNADRPEWETDPHLIPAHEVDELIYWNTQPDVSLLPIGPDGDAGTKAITDAEARADDLLRQLREAVDHIAVLEAPARAAVAHIPVPLGGTGTRAIVEPRRIEDQAELDALPVGSIVMDSDGDAWQRTPERWRCPLAGAPSLPTGGLIANFESVTVLHTPAEVTA